MSVDFAAEAQVKRTNNGFAAIPENIVVQPELSGRSEATDITELAKDIESNGQLEPAVCWKNADGFPVLAAGHRRYRAVEKINETRPSGEKLRLHFSYIRVKNEQEAFDYTVRENRNRVNPSALDDSTNMHIYQTRYGLSEEEIADKYFPLSGTEEEKNKALKYVQDCLKLLELSDTAKEEIRSGFISTTAALQLAEIPSRRKQDEVILEEKAKGSKRLKVSAAKSAKEAVNGRQRNRNISENNPSKVIERLKKFAQVAAALAEESLCKEWGRHPDRDLIFEYSSQILSMASRLNIPLDSGADSWAHEHQVVTVLDGA
jgi:ParB-like chromosome segregation protein Spo0J